MICGSGGSKSRFAKAAGAEPAEQMRDEKLHAIVARSTFASEKAQNTSRSEHVLKLICRKSARRCGAKHISKSKCTKHTRSGPVAARSTFRSQHVQNTPCSDHFWKLRCRKSARRCGISKSKAQKTVGYGALLEVQMCFRVAGARDCGPCQKWAKREGFVAFKNDGKRGTFEEDLKRCIFRGRRNTRDMFIRDVRRSGRWFPEKGCILEHRIFSLPRWFCVTGAALRMTRYHFFVAGAVVLDRWSRKIARPSALHSILHLWRKSRRIGSFLMFSTEKNQEISQNCFVFDVVKCKKLRKSRRIIAFFDVVKFQNWVSLAESLRFQACRSIDRQTDRQRERDR